MTALGTAIVFGKGTVAIHAAQVLRKAGFELRAIVPSTTEFRDQPRLGEWALQQGIEVINSADFSRASADLGLSVYFDRIFRAQHIARFGRLLNVHNSLLPRNRGVRPINWALKSGEQQHGVSLHEIEAGIDTGPVLRQIGFPIDPDVDEVADVYGRCVAVAKTLLTESAPRLLTMVAEPQNDSLATTHLVADDDLLGDRRYWRRGDRGLQ